MGGTENAPQGREKAKAMTSDTKVLAERIVDALLGDRSWVSQSNSKLPCPSALQAVFTHSDGFAVVWQPLFRNSVIAIVERVLDQEAQDAQGALAAIEGGATPEKRRIYGIPGYRHIRIVPGVSAGLPTIKRRGIIAEHLAGMVRGGDSVESVAADYDIPIAAVEEAVRMFAFQEGGATTLASREARMENALVEAITLLEFVGTDDWDADAEQAARELSEEWTPLVMGIPDHHATRRHRAHLLRRTDAHGYWERPAPSASASRSLGWQDGTEPVGKSQETEDEKRGQ